MLEKVCDAAASAVGESAGVGELCLLGVRAGRVLASVKPVTYWTPRPSESYKGIWRIPFAGTPSLCRL